MEQYKANG